MAILGFVNEVWQTSPTPRNMITRAPPSDTATLAVLSTGIAVIFPCTADIKLS
jgi:hypothetical protein